MTKLVERTYAPEGYSKSATQTGMVTEEQAIALDTLAKEDSVFSAAFWMGRILAMNNGDKTDYGLPVLRMNGHHYIAGERNTGTNKGMLGYGGREWTVEYTTGPDKGTFVYTNNMWHQGEIPEQLKPVMPDNAQYCVRSQAVVDILASLGEREGFAQ